MRTLTGVEDHEHLGALVIRTDFDHPEVWSAVREALTRSVDGEPSRPLVVDDPAWAGASADEIRQAVLAHEGLGETLSAAFVADRTTMRSPHHALLAVLTAGPEDFEDEEDYAAAVEYGTEFRVVPAGAYEVHANLDIGNMGFEEYAEAARDAPDGVLDWWGN